MRTKLLVVLFILVLCVAFTYKNPTIHSNVSAYNGLKIDSSMLKDIESVYGFDYEIDTWTTTVVVGTKSGQSVPINKISYPAEGISFVMLGDDINKALIHNILFTYPFKGSTEKDITIGKSTFADVIEKYGNGYWDSGNQLDSKKLSLSYGSVAFRTEKFFTEDEFKRTDKEQFLKLTVTEIALERMSY